MSKSQISLENFYIFNSTFGPKEGEEEKKILFFHPEEVDQNEKLKSIGYIEALIKFTGTFSLEPSSSKDVMVMKTTKFTKLFYEPEKDYIIVMTIKNPKEQLKTKDNKEHTEHYSDDVHSDIFKKVLQRCYLNFRLFCNTFEYNMKGDDLETKIDNLKMKLNNFFVKYLVTLNLKNCSIFDMMQCVQYKSVSHHTFFRIINFINMLLWTSSLRIKKCIFLYNQEVIYSSIDPLDLYIINEYMTESLFPKYFRLRNHQGLDRNATGNFVTENEDESLKNAPKIYLYGDGNRKFECEAYRLVIYHIMDVSLVMFIEDIEDLNDELCNEIKYSISPLAMISKEISDNISQLQQNLSKTNNSDESNQKNFIYFNQRNYRFHACFNDNIHENAITSRESKRNNNQLSQSVMNLLCDLYGKEPSEELIDTERETIIKTYNDFWIAKKSFNFRTLYLIFHKNFTLIDVSEETQKLSAEIVKNVYFGAPL